MTPPKSPILTAGLLTDAHYLDIPNRGELAHRAAIERVAEAAHAFQNHHADIAIQLGDIIDQTPECTPDDQKRDLRRILSEFAPFRGELHSVPGNHCLHVLSAEEYEEASGAPIGYRSRDYGAIRLIFLNACYRQDGVPYGGRNNQWFDASLPSQERECLEADLQSAEGRVFVFTHQRLDAPPDSLFGIFEAKEIRNLLERSGKVAAVFQGHQHQNLAQNIEGIPYVTLHAVAHDFETNAYSLLRLYENGDFCLEGFGRHADHPFALSTTP